MGKMFRNNWIRAAVINAVVLAVFLLCTDFAYETNDDYVISLRIGSGYPYNTFINYFLCKALIAVQALMPNINIFVLFQVVASWTCFFLITKLFLDLSDEKAEENFRNSGFGTSDNNQNSAPGKSKIFVTVAVFAIITVFAGDHYCIIQFTKTSALMLITGMFVLVDAIIRKRPTGYYVGAIVFIYLGTWLRYMNLPVAIGCAGVFLVFWIIINRKAIIDRGYVTGRRIAVYAVCLLCIAGAGGTYLLSMNINTGTEELADFNEYDLYRSYVVDYPVYEDYKQNPQKYKDTGLSDNDMYLISNWYIDFNGAASLENLKNLNAVYKSDNSRNNTYAKATKAFVKETASDMRDFNRRGMHFILLGIIALMSFIVYKPKYWIYILAACGFAAAIYIYLFYLGRPLYRATYIADLGTMIWLLYYADDKYLREKFAEHFGNKCNSGESKDVSKSNKGMIILAAVAILLLISCQTPIHDKATELKNAAVAGQMQPEMEAFLETHEEGFFVFGNGTRGKTEFYATPLKIPPADYQKNALGFGSWGTKSPYLIEKMATYGITNVFGDLIDNENAFVFEDVNVARLEKYFNKWYNNRGEILFKNVDNVAGHRLYRVVTSGK